MLSLTFHDIMTIIPKGSDIPKRLCNIEYLRNERKYCEILLRKSEEEVIIRKCQLCVAVLRTAIAKCKSLAPACTTTFVFSFVPILTYQCALQAIAATKIVLYVKLDIAVIC